MKKGLVDYAESRAKEIFYRWNDETGVFDPSQSHFYEIEACIVDAVHVGIQVALHGNIKFNLDGEIIHGDTKEKQS